MWLWLDKHLNINNLTLYNLMKHFISLAIAASLAFSAFAADEPTDSAKIGFQFTDQITIPTNSVKDQNKSGTCWCFSGLSFIEDDILRRTGQSVDLSEMFIVRHCYQAKADRFVRMYGQANFAPGGSFADVIWGIQNYGLVPEEAYTGLQYGEDKHMHGELDAILSGLVHAVVAKPDKYITPAWPRALAGVLDAYLGVLPESFTVNGKSFTPQTYAKSLGVNPDDFIAITSFTHHPFGTYFSLEIPDNWLNAPYLNVTLDQLKATVDNALANGYSVAWAADVSEDGFKWKEGVALMPAGKDESGLEGTELARWTTLSDKDRVAERYAFTGPVPEETVTQESRQRMFDSQQTTDDHGMVIVGTAVDQEGNHYYKVKNSWDTNQVYNGYIYVSDAFFLAKTLSIMVNRKAVPAGIIPTK